MVGHSKLPVNFKRKTFAKFGMRKHSLKPIATDEEKFKINSSRNLDF